MKRRKPQPVCKCSHAKSQHYWLAYSSEKPDTACSRCFDHCVEFQQDNLLTLEKLSKFNEEK